jgi:hypothetical protein
MSKLKNPTASEMGRKGAAACTEAQTQARARNIKAGRAKRRPITIEHVKMMNAARLKKIAERKNTLDNSQRSE